MSLKQTKLTEAPDTETTDAEEILRRIERMDKPYTDAEVLRFMYHQAGMSLKEIANRFGCSDTTVRTWMDDFGIERRGMNEGFRLAQIKDTSTGDTASRSGGISRFIEADD